MLLNKKKLYRFYYHYYKQYKEMSVHYRGTCHRVKGIVCNVPCETKYNKRQPYLVMQGYCSSVIIENNTAYIT